MNRREKQVAAASLRDEAKVLRDVRDNYAQARKDITDKIEALLAREQTQSVVWQLQYQEMLRSQIDSALDALESRNYLSIHDYLENEYENGYIGAMYDIAGQGIPFTLPLDQTRVAKMVETGADGIKLSKRLYGNTTKLKNVVRREVSIGLASAESFQDIAARITRATGQDYSKTFRIAKTEGGRVASSAQLDALEKAKKAGADIVKQWDSALDNRTRPAHRQLDGQVRELDEPFEVDGFKARCPHDFGKPWLDINCRCRMNQRARWALDEDELKTLKERAEFYGLDKTKDFEDFRARYIRATEDIAEKEAAEKMGVSVLGEVGKVKPSKSFHVMSDSELLKRAIGLDAEYVETVNPITDYDKFKGIAQAMRDSGWSGRPVLAVDMGDNQYQGLTGSHRVFAARDAKIEVKAIVVDYDDYIEELISASDDDLKLAVARHLHQEGKISDEVLSLIEREVDSNLEPEKDWSKMAKKYDAERKKEAEEAAKEAEEARKAEEEAKARRAESPAMVEYKSYLKMLTDKYDGDIWSRMSDDEMEKLERLERKAYKG